MKCPISERSEAILNTFMELAKQYSIDRTTMQDISKQMGMSVGSLYQVYKGKKELIIALIERVIEELFGKLEQGIRSKVTAIEKLHVMTVQFYKLQLEAMHANRSIAEFILRRDILLRYINNDFRALRDKNMERYRDALSAILREGIEKGEFTGHDTEATAQVFMHAFEGYAFNAYGSARLHEWDNEVETMFNTLTRGICHARS
jgi:AcrR family transcriptional regulator